MRRLRTLLPALAVLAVNEFTVMCILSVVGIPDGPLTYLIDAVLLAVLSAPLLYIWLAQDKAPFADRAAREPLVRQIPTLEELERQAVLRALEAAHGDRERAARLLGVGRSTL